MQGQVDTAVLQPRVAFASYTAGGTSTVEVDLIVAIPHNAGAAGQNLRPTEVDCRMPPASTQHSERALSTTKSVNRHIYSPKVEVEILFRCTCWDQRLYFVPFGNHASWMITLENYVHPQLDSTWHVAPPGFPAGQTQTAVQQVQCRAMPTANVTTRCHHEMPLHDLCRLSKFAWVAASCCSTGGASVEHHRMMTYKVSRTADPKGLAPHVSRHF